MFRKRNWLLISERARWRQVEWSMPFGVCHLVFAVLMAHLAALYDYPVFQDRTSQSWFSMVKQHQGAEVSTCCSKTLFLLSFLCSFLSEGWIEFSLLFFSARKTQHIFPLLTQTSLSLHAAFFISVLNTQRKQTHTLGGVQTMRKSVPWPKNCNDRMFAQSSDKTVDADCSLIQLPESVLPKAPLIYNQQTRRVYLLCISGSQLLCLHSLHSALSPNNNEWALSRLQRACAFVWSKHY